jgi:BirA family biotin operon repressor/biotin-[acetyl-CoA-carboxylase] ligase
MTATASPLFAPYASGPACRSDWVVTVEAEVDSTNRLAARLPAWHAVRADVQSAGRGRTGKHWVSDPGGLWLSAVLPCPGPRERWATLPLAAGWALIAALNDLGVSDLRLRWPNDILVGRRKLAGLLVERHTADTAVVGIGLNVFNSPESADPALRDATTRLADLIAPFNLSLDEVATLVLDALARAHHRLATGGFAPIAADLNRTWQEPRLVELTLAGADASVIGAFHGIDACGHLRLRTPDGALTTYDATRVAHLRELE